MSTEQPDAAEFPVLWAVMISLGKLGPVAEQDQAAHALARRYAHDIDHARVLSTQGAQILRDLKMTTDPVVYNRLETLLARIEATTVLALLGPKLTVVLTELGMTPRARADVTRKGGAQGNGTPPESELARLRRERMARLKDA